MLAGALLMTATGCRISKEDVLEEEVFMAVAVIMVNYIMSHRCCNSYLQKLLKMDSGLIKWVQDRTETGL
jgi:hypothetical protein